MRARVMCGVSHGDSPLTLDWLKDGRPLSMGGSSTVQVMVLDPFTSVLSINSLTAEHSGKYTCKAQNAAATVRFDATLTVYALHLAGRFAGNVTPSIHISMLASSPQSHYAAHILHNHRIIASYTSVPPSWILEPKDSQVLRGQPIVIDCAARGYPEPTLTWKKKVGSGSDAFRNVELVRPRAEHLSNGSLYIAGAEPDHAGTYVCHASNSVKFISSTIYIAVNSAPYFIVGTNAAEVRAGEKASLECRVKGDAPLTLTWAINGSPLPRSSRYSETVKVEPGGSLLGVIVIYSTTQSDAGDYTCTAHNDFGRNSRHISLSVHEPPSAPRELRVVDGGSRSVRVSWAAPEPSPSSYIVQFRDTLKGWGESREISIQADVIATRGGIEISPLNPATAYVVRVFAINHLGRSPASEALRFTTSPEKPGAAPMEVRAEAVGPTEVKVSWRPPPERLAHGNILGFYLGYAPAIRHTSQSPTPQYNFTTVKGSQAFRSGEEGFISKGEILKSSIMEGIRSPGDDGDRLWIVKVDGLQPYTEYHVVVQAFNREGSGPLSPPVSVITREDVSQSETLLPPVPGGPPQECRCTGLSWDSVQVSWDMPDPRSHHGVLRGYKIDYERWDGWSDVVRGSQTSALTAVVTGLEAATNYSMRVRAYTSVGDGPWSIPILCTTLEDVPGRIGAIKAVVASSESFITSWSPPQKPNGHIVSYKITWRVVGAILGEGRGTEGVSTVAGTVNFIKVEGVKGRLVEMEIVAATREGEGPPTATRVTLTNTIPAAIYSTSNSLRPQKGEDVTLPCGHVGQPQPSLVWSYQQRPVDREGRIFKNDGGLLVQDVQREDSGNYTCTVSNSHGTDHLTHYMAVLVPPSPSLVLASSSSESSVQVQWKPGDDGGSPIIRFSLYYRKDHGAWTHVNLQRRTHSHILTALECGSRYHIYVVSHNEVGGSPASSTAVVRTLGGPPQPPQAEHFFALNATTVAIFPKAWIAQGCPITHMVLEYRQHKGQHWVQVSSGWPQENRVDVGGLESATTYLLRATAVTSAGSSTHSYTFTTLTAKGEISPMWSDAGWNQWSSARVLLPLLTSVIALASSLTIVCYCLRRKMSPTEGSTEVSDGEREKRTNTAVMENKHNMAQREQYYATIRKSNPRDNQSDTAPEEADDIYPYATFPLSSQANQESGHIPMMPLCQAHNGDKKGDNYGETKQKRRPLQRHNRSRSRGGGADSGDDYEMLGSETETEHGGVSSRTESSNQLDDIPSIRDHSIYGRGGGGGGGGESIYSRENASRPLPTKEMHREAGFAPREGPHKNTNNTPAFQQRIHHNLLYHAESSTSPEPSPTTERKSFLRHPRARSRVKSEGTKAGASSRAAPANATGPMGPLPAAMPPSYPGVAEKRDVRPLLGHPNRRGPNHDPSEVSEAECDRDILPPPRRYSDTRFKGHPSQDYSIAV
ncbi:hypothetical protein SK128_025459 [Halocaridina rubra]|uniref:Down syndrome cell adhesion molecule-like protein Dscam2 n=1 Tax=Halocaridina rubra TaxID=373956 RepID=A0AAN8WXP9_HALRR